jgi:hypothetical protein
MCSGCGVAYGRIDGADVRLPESWERSDQGDFCLACRRSRAGDAALDELPEAAGPDERARARRGGLIAFEVLRSPERTDGAIARVCRTSTRTVTATRRRLAESR